MDATYAERVARAWSEAGTPRRSFWTSPVVMAEINRRISGDANVDPVSFFRGRFCPQPRRRALSLGSGGGELELQMALGGVCRSLLGTDLSPVRVEAANKRVPVDRRHEIGFEVHNLEAWRPQERFDLIVARDALHHLVDLEGWCAALPDLLEPGGLVYVHDFVGPARFQWTDRQLEVINRLMDRLPDRLRVDLVEPNGVSREHAGRPDVGRFIAADPSEAVDPQAIPVLLERHLEPVLVRPYGGALFHQFFNRIMGNFDDDPDLVRMIMEFDFLLTDWGGLPADYLWGVYRRRGDG